MATRLTLEMPESALRRFIDACRACEPTLMAMLNELGVIAVLPHDELSLAQWENEGGSVAPDTT